MLRARSASNRTGHVERHHKVNLPVITADLAAADMTVATGLVSHRLAARAGESAAWVER